MLRLWSYSKWQWTTIVPNDNFWESSRPKIVGLTDNRIHWRSTIQSTRNLRCEYILVNSELPIITLKLRILFQPLFKYQRKGLPVSYDAITANRVDLIWDSPSCSTNFNFFLREYLVSKELQCNLQKCEYVQICSQKGSSHPSDK